MTDREYFQLILNYFIVKIKLISLLLAATSFLSATAQQKIPIFFLEKKAIKVTVFPLSSNCQTMICWHFTKAVYMAPATLAILI